MRSGYHLWTAYCQILNKHISINVQAQLHKTNACVKLLCICIVRGWYRLLKPTRSSYIFFLHIFTEVFLRGSRQVLVEQARVHILEFKWLKSRGDFPHEKSFYEPSSKKCFVFTIHINVSSKNQVFIIDMLTTLFDDLNAILQFV